MFQNFLIWEGDMEAAGVEACGMFTPTHLIVTVICLALLLLAVYFSRGIREEQLRRVVLCIAVLVTVLECCKIAFNWINGGHTPNHWLPLTFCSFSTYAYWTIAFGEGRWYEAAKGFICGGGIIAGLTFLVIPMTSVATYPMFHLLSCYSMLYHSLMMYVGLTFVTNGYFQFNKHGYNRYLAFTLPACLLALGVNLFYGAVSGDITTCNMMFLSSPHLLGEMIPFIGWVYETITPLYTIGALAVYLILPFLIPYGVVRLIELIRRKTKKA
ncbi:MAG: YwaF family protein [Clostridia bacterium]|nr:YwaF family protein [Clostridia bacterium]